MEEILVCCGSIFFLGAILIGTFSFSVFSRGHKPSTSAIETSPAEAREAHRNRLEFLLAIIGMWIGLPSLCSISQEVVRTFVSFENIVNEDTGKIIKMVSDGCLFGALFTGLIILIAVTITTWGTSFIGLKVSSWMNSIKMKLRSKPKPPVSPVHPTNEPIKKQGDNYIKNTSREFFLTKFLDGVWTRITKTPHQQIDDRNPELIKPPAAITELPHTNKDELRDLPPSSGKALEDQGMSFYVQKVRKRNPNFP